MIKHLEQTQLPRWHAQTRCTAFHGSRRAAAGELAHVAVKAKSLSAPNRSGPPVLVFDDATGEQIDLDLRGQANEIVRRLRPAPGEPSEDADKPAGPGRPKLGVIAREVTLLPRHWEWLGTQPGGASAALRRLVETARRENAGKDRIRRSQEAAYRFMSAMAGNRPGFEEATRALFAGDAEQFEELTGAWPAAIRDYARKLAAEALRGEVREVGSHLRVQIP